MRTPARTIGALALAAVLTTTAANAAVEQHSGALPHGGSYVLQRNATVGSAAIELWFRAPSAGYAEPSPGISDVAAAACAASRLNGGKSLAQMIRESGGRLNVNVYPDMLSVSALVPSAVARRVVAAMTAAYFTPVITNDGFALGQRDAAVQAIERRYSIDQVAHDALFAQIFTSGPARYAPLPDNADALLKMKGADATAFAKRAFRASNALMILSGNVDNDILSAVTNGSPGNMDAPLDSHVAARPQSDSNESAAISGVGLAWKGPPIADERAATALDFINDYLFRQETGAVQTDLARTGSTADLTGQFITLHDPGVMVVSIGGRDADAVRDRVARALATLQQPLDGAAFEAAKQAFVYHIESDSSTPLGIADNLGWYGTEGNAAYAPGDASGGYVRVAQSLDAKFVASVVQKYLGATPIVVHLARAKGNSV